MSDKTFLIVVPDDIAWQLGMVFGTVYVPYYGQVMDIDILSLPMYEIEAWHAAHAVRESDIYADPSYVRCSVSTHSVISSLVGTLRIHRPR